MRSPGCGSSSSTFRRHSPWRRSYLTRLFPDRRLFRFRRFANHADVIEELLSAQLAFPTPNQLDLLPALDADLFVNVSSLREMRPEQISHCFGVIDRHCSGHFYTKQWKRSVNENDRVVIARSDYPVPAHWRPVYSRSHGAQRRCFEALYDVGGPAS